MGRGEKNSLLQTHVLFSPKIGLKLLLITGILHVIEMDFICLIMYETIWDKKQLIHDPFLSGLRR